MTKEELKNHCEKQIEGCEMWARHNGEEPHGKVYEEHKLILEILEENEDFQKYIDKANNTNSQLIQIIEKHKMYRDTSDDCVSRAEVLKGYIEIRRIDGVEVYSDKVIPMEYVEALPPVTPTQKWIPVNKRLPNQEVEVLTCNECGFIEIQSLEDGYWENQHGDCTDLEDSDIVAWQPLPKPYKEKRGNENGGN